MARSLYDRTPITVTIDRWYARILLDHLKDGVLPEENEFWEEARADIAMLVDTALKEQ